MFQALGSLLGGGGKEFPYTLGDETARVGCWQLHTATRTDRTGGDLSVFAFELKDQAPQRVAAARNAFKRFKTLRHPNFLSYVDSVETQTHLYIVTEAVVPLRTRLPELREFKNGLTWGLYQVTKGISFLNNDCKSVHFNLSPATIFVNRAGDWLIGGFDLTSEFKSPIDTLLNGNTDLLADKYKSPEYAKCAWSVVEGSKPWAVDAWSLGCTIFEIYSGEFLKQQEIRTTTRIPAAIVPLYQKLLTQTPTTRMNPSKLLESEFFQTKLIQTHLFLENMAIKDAAEKDRFFQALPTHLGEIPVHSQVHKILPQLTTALEYGAVGSRVLAPVLQIGKHLEADEYTTKIVPCVVKLFASNDRAMRIQLLQNLGSFIQHLSDAVVNDQIFPHVVNGFLDTSPNLRDATVKSMILFVPKLGEKNINTQVLRHFAKLQVDQEPGIRTNTTICLGKVSGSFTPATRAKVLVPAFTRALKDPFPPARAAGLMSLTATAEHYAPQEIAARIVPAIVGLLLDQDKTVRSSARACLTAFEQALQAASKSIDNQQEQHEAAASGSDQAQSAASGGAGAPRKLSSTASGMFNWAYSSVKGQAMTITGGGGGSGGSGGGSGGAGGAGGSDGGASQPAPAPAAPADADVPEPEPSAADGWDDADDVVSFDKEPEKEIDGWGHDDDGDDFWTEAAKPAPKAEAPASSGGGGWDDDDGDGWDFAPAKKVPVSTTRKTGAGAKTAEQRREERQRRMAERKLATPTGKKAGLGAVRKVD